MHRRVRRAPAKPRRNRHCIGPGTQDSSAPKSQLDGEGRLVRRAPWRRRRSGGHPGQARWGGVGVGDLAPEAQPWQPRRHSPSTCSGCPPRRWLWGAWPRPCLHRSPRGGASPREPQRWLKEAAKETAQSPPAAAVGVGATTTPRCPDGSQGPSSLPTPQRLSAQLIRYLLFYGCPGIQPPSFLWLPLFLLLAVLPHPLPSSSMFPPPSFILFALEGSAQGFPPPGSLLPCPSSQPLKLPQ